MLIVGVTGNFVRDHNHDSGKGREWICENCNGGVLGGADDSIEFLQRVINYIKKECKSIAIGAGGVHVTNSISDKKTFNKCA